MRFVLSILILFFAIGMVRAQEPTKLSYEVLKEMQKTDKKAQQVGIIVRGEVDAIRSAVEQLGGVLKYSFDGIAAVRLPLGNIQELADNTAIRRIEMTIRLPQPLNNRMVINTRATLVHQGAAPLTQGYDGSGVVIGIIDTGIDFDHPDFKNPDGTTRILNIWDHDVFGTPPTGYSYGMEWNAGQIDGGSCTHVDDYNGAKSHGTVVSGIAGGNGLAIGAYGGAAPNARFIVVALNYTLGSPQSTAISDAVQYIFNKADGYGMPCVINASVGSYAGSHDGLDLQALLIDSLISAKNGRAMVAAAGNNGDTPFHLGNYVTSDTSFTWFKYRVKGPFDPCGTCFYIWADTANLNNVQFSIGADDPATWSLRGNTNFDNIQNRLGMTVCDTIMNGPNRIGIVCTYGELLSNGRYRLTVDVLTDSTTYYWRLMTTGSGYFDVWSRANITRTASMVDDTAQLPDSVTLPEVIYYQLPDTFQTMVSSFQCSDKVITVANYMNRVDYIDVDGFVRPLSNVYVVDDIDPSSSLGPTRDGRMKPDIAGPGSLCIGPVALNYLTAFLNNSRSLIVQGGMHSRLGGTSASSPAVAGVVALYLQKNNNANWKTIKDAFITCSFRDQFTTPYANYKWGNGKVDAYAALTCNLVYGCTDPIAFNFNVNANVDDNSCVYTIGIDKIDKYGTALITYPNPFSDRATILYKFDKPGFGTAELVITNVVGEQVSKIYLNDNQSRIQLSKDNLRSGIYFYSLVVDGETIKTSKLIVL